MWRGYIAAIFISRPNLRSYIPQLQMRLRSANLLAVTHAEVGGSERKLL